MGELNPNDRNWRGLVAAMRAARNDDTPRLEFCDLVDEQSNDDPFLKLIRIQCDLARRDRRGNALGRLGWEQVSPEFYVQQLEAHDCLRRSWLMFPFCRVDPELPERHLNQWRWVRGFPEEIVCSFDFWAEWAERITAMGPVGDLLLTTEPTVHLTDHPMTRMVEVSVEEPSLARIRYETGRDFCTRLMISEREISLHGMRHGATRVAIENILRGVWREGDAIRTLTIDPTLDRVVYQEPAWPLNYRAAEWPPPGSSPG